MASNRGCEGRPPVARHGRRVPREERCLRCSLHDFLYFHSVARRRVDDTMSDTGYTSFGQRMCASCERRAGFTGGFETSYADEATS